VCKFFPQNTWFPNPALANPEPPPEEPAVGAELRDKSSLSRLAGTDALPGLLLLHSACVHHCCSLRLRAALTHPSQLQLRHVPRGSVRLASQARQTACTGCHENGGGGVHAPSALSRNLQTALRGPEKLLLLILLNLFQ